MTHRRRLRICYVCISLFSVLFFFNDTATTEIYTLSLHDALPISLARKSSARGWSQRTTPGVCVPASIDRKSTRLNSSHQIISYAVFCLKKKNKMRHPPTVCIIAAHPYPRRPRPRHGGHHGKTPPC